MKPDRELIAEPNWQGMCGELNEENHILKERAKIMEEEYQKKIDALETERQFLLGQVRAFEYCIKGGVKE
jgi:hypothetical protein